MLNTKHKEQQRCLLVHLTFIMLVIALLFTSCAKKESNLRRPIDSENEIADATFSDVIYAVKEKNNLKIKEMFSYTIQQQDDIEQDIISFFEFIHGDITSYSLASDAGVGTDYQRENGKNIKVIQSSFIVDTSESTYYIAIRECIVDELDTNNVGILSIYIIEAKDWTDNYVYRGDGEWTPGINISRKID